MTITRHNYEVFLVDYLDGRLNPSLVAELLVFLDLNPEIKEELDGLQDAVLIGETIPYPDRSNLKKKSFLKNGIDDEFEYLSIASAEGIITQSEKEALESILQEDPKKQILHLTFQKAIVNPDKTTIYALKSRLKRTSLIPIRVSTFRQSISIAATIALVIGVYTISKLMVNNDSLNKYSKATIAESTTTPAITTTNEVQNNIAPLKVEPIRTKPDQEFIGDNKKTISTPKIVRINIEESIPNIIHRIDFSEPAIPENPQTEQLAEIASKYALVNRVSNEQFAQQESSNRRNDAKEIGVFEIIQYGVQSFGKLIGSDINLKANKDEKGNIEKINFESNLVAFSAPVRKKE